MTDPLAVGADPAPYWLSQDGATPVERITAVAGRWSLAQADRHDGRRNIWLRTLDRVGVGFDS